MLITRRMDKKNQRFDYYYYFIKHWYMANKLCRQTLCCDVVCASEIVFGTAGACRKSHKSHAKQEPMETLPQNRFFFFFFFFTSMRYNDCIHDILVCRHAISTRWKESIYRVWLFVIIVIRYTCRIHLIWMNPTMRINFEYSFFVFFVLNFSFFSFHRQLRVCELCIREYLWFCEPSILVYNIFRSRRV